MDRKELVSQLAAYEENYCKKCTALTGKNLSNQPTMKLKICTEQCPIGQQIRDIGRKLERVQPEPEEPKKPKVSSRSKFRRNRNPWTENEEFYLINHFNVLGKKRVAEKLRRSEKAVYDKYRRLMEEEKTHHQVG